MNTIQILFVINFSLIAAAREVSSSESFNQKVTYEEFRGLLREQAHAINKYIEKVLKDIDHIKNYKSLQHSLNQVLESILEIRNMINDVLNKDKSKPKNTINPILFLMPVLTNSWMCNDCQGCRKQTICLYYLYLQLINMTSSEDGSHENTISNPLIYQPPIPNMNIQHLMYQIQQNQMINPSCNPLLPQLIQMMMHCKTNSPYPSSGPHQSVSDAYCQSVPQAPVNTDTYEPTFTTNTPHMNTCNSYNPALTSAIPHQSCLVLERCPSTFDVCSIATHKYEKKDKEKH